MSIEDVAYDYLVSRPEFEDEPNEDEVVEWIKENVK